MEILYQSVSWIVQITFPFSEKYVFLEMEIIGDLLGMSLERRIHMVQVSHCWYFFDHKTYSIACKVMFPVRNTFSFIENGFNMTKIWLFLCFRVLEKGTSTSFGSYIFENLWVMRPIPLCSENLWLMRPIPIQLNIVSPKSHEHYIMCLFTKIYSYICDLIFTSIIWMLVASSISHDIWL